jgi:hypothetical protein
MTTAGRLGSRGLILPRFLPRERALKIVGETWKKRLRSRGVEVLGEAGFSFSRLLEKAVP